MPILFSLVFNNLSPWWIITCFIIGFLYAFIFYQKSIFDQKYLRSILFAFRFILVSLLVLLLLSPLFKADKQQLQKPLIIIAQDASQSIKFSRDKALDTATYHKNLKQLTDKLSENYEVKQLQFSTEVESGFDFAYSGKQTDISSLINYTTKQFPNQNIGAFILATDGIYNQGANPISLLTQIKSPIYTVALGDTIPKKDLVLQTPNYNQVVYLNAKHELEVPISAFMAKGLASELIVKTNDGQIKSQFINFNNDDFYKTFKIQLSTVKKGIQKIDLSLKSISGEFSVENNHQTIYVEVLDGRENILILANAPHPDISALKQSIQSNQNYEVTTAFADNLPKNKDFDLVVFHDLPSQSHPITDFIANYRNKNKWFIIGTNTLTSSVNKFQDAVQLNTNGQSQAYYVQLNTNFYLFNLADATKNFLQNLAPLNAPFRNYSLNGNAQVLLNQQIGKVKTNQPLLAFAQSKNTKTAVLTGEGIWRWRMDNYAENENFEAFDELITKSVQYLSAKDDKRKFRVTPLQSRFAENEEIVVNAELYNDAYELINSTEVSISLVSKSGKKYSYLFSKTGNSYQLNAGLLPPNEYFFEAKTTLGKQNYSAKGNFLVEEINTEFLQTTANHQLLYNLSETTGGKMLEPENLLQISDLIKANEKVKTIITTESVYQPLIDMKWIFALLMIFLSVEWFLRKRNGAI